MKKLLSLLMIVVLAVSLTGCATMSNVGQTLGTPTQVQADVTALGGAAKSYIGSTSAAKIHTFATNLVAGTIDLNVLATNVPTTGNTKADALIRASIALIQLAVSSWGASSPNVLLYEKAVGQGLLNAGF